MSEFKAITTQEEFDKAIQEDNDKKKVSKDSTQIMRI